MVTIHCSKSKSVEDGMLATSGDWDFCWPHWQSAHRSTSIHIGMLFCHSSCMCLRKFSARLHCKYKTSAHKLTHDFPKGIHKQWSPREFSYEPNSAELCLNWQDRVLFRLWTGDCNMYHNSLNKYHNVIIFVRRLTNFMDIVNLQYTNQIVIYALSEEHNITAWSNLNSVYISRNLYQFQVTAGSINVRLLFMDV